MNINSLLVTGDRSFLNRHQYLFSALSNHVPQLDYLPVDSRYDPQWLKQFVKTYLGKLPIVANKRASALRKTAQTFVAQSRRTEQQIRSLPQKPDLVFHMLGLYSPFWEQFEIPYVMHLDYTMALAERHWKAWAPFAKTTDLQDWLACERRAYDHAIHLLPMSQAVQTSLIQDYGISPEKITVVGSSGHFAQPYSGNKSFGSKQILFNGSDFERKGGDRVLSAFRLIQQTIPDATLQIIGNNHLSIDQPGVTVSGHIKSTLELENLFLNSDLVLAPARCEPFALFIIEAMNYGVPCLVSACDGITEIVEHGVNGWIADPPTPDAIAQAAIQLLQHPAQLKSLSLEAQLKVSTSLNWEAVAQRIHQAIARLESVSAIRV